MTHQPGVYVPLRALFLVIIMQLPTLIRMLSILYEPGCEKTSLRGF